MDIIENNENNQVHREERNPFLRAAGEQYTRNAVQDLMGINPKTWGDLEKKGVIPPTGTYKELIQRIHQHYKKGNAAKVERWDKQNEGGEEDEIRILQAEKLEGEIRLNKAREEQILLSNNEKRLLLVDKGQMYSLIEPFISNIATVLRNASMVEPALQSTIDEVFISLQRTGVELMKQCDLDGADYVNKALLKDINLLEVMGELE